MGKSQKNTNEVKTLEKAETGGVTIGPNDGHSRSKEKVAWIASQAKLHNDSRSPELLRKNGMKAIQYRMEQYANDDQVTFENLYNIEDFVNDFLKVLGSIKVHLPDLLKWGVQI